MPPRIAILPGDGIGPEVIDEAVKVLQAAGVDAEFEFALIGGAAIAQGYGLSRSGKGIGRGLGVVTLLAGIAAVGLSFAAMNDREAWTFAAGAAGTAATALFAVVLLFTPAGVKD